MRPSTSAKIIAALSAAFCLALPALAVAQQSPYDQQPPPPGPQSPYDQQPPYGPQAPPEQQPPQAPPAYPAPPPPYARPAPNYATQQGIKGVVTAFDGQWVVYMHDDKGYEDHITLHQGTIINPTGIRLIEGMRITVYGYADGPTYQANRVDVAYSPYSPYYGYGGYPNPYYGYGYGYGGYPYPYYGWGWPYWGIGIGVNWGWGWGWGWRGGCCWGGWRGGWGGWGGYRGPWR